ncbi:MAG TPA: hypothetical protein VLG11_02520 [Candidatus Saccharimonadales bacterium]|nr:hypothetical protein [Candidatus Saccharimonadales bacterium]
MEEDHELQAMSQVNAALKDLSEEERYRVMQWAANKYLQNAAPLKLAGPAAPAATTPVAVLDADVIMPDDDGADEAPTYDTFAEMLDASGADTDAERFLVAAYWLQITNEQASWKSFEINKLLKDTGKQINTIGNAVRDLTKKSKTKPALVVQVSKNTSSSGKGSKVLKLTSEGIKKTKTMLGLV